MVTKTFLLRWASWRHWGTTYRTLDHGFAGLPDAVGYENNYALCGRRAPGDAHFKNGVATTPEFRCGTCVRIAKERGLA